MAHLETKRRPKAPVFVGMIGRLAVPFQDDHRKVALVREVCSGARCRILDNEFAASGGVKLGGQCESPTTVAISVRAGNDFAGDGGFECGHLSHLRFGSGLIALTTVNLV